MDRDKKALELAEQILKYARNEMMVSLRFMDLALCKLKYLGKETKTMETDGEYLYYNPWYVFKLYQAEDNSLNRTYLHSIFHCIFYHPFVDKEVNRPLWNIACDIAVEAIIIDLGVKQLEDIKDTLQNKEIMDIAKLSGKATAERIYRYFVKSGKTAEDLKDLEELFKRDSHDAWYVDKKPESQNTTKAAGVASTAAFISEDSSSGSSGNGNISTSGGMSFSSITKEEWEKISQRVKIDIETISNGRWGTSEFLLQNITEVNREKYDYTDFLKKFAVLGEAMQINDDEFDYNFYTYGLSLYKNVPLIEPLEYKEVKRIKEFVLAIDTSGSVQGDLVQSFVQKTYNVLKSTESFFSKINLHIIQCDDQLQEDKKITSQEEFDEYFKTMELHGFGGNNEVLLFSYVDELIEKGEFTNLKGMIYFTDGYGIFPEKKPNYDVAFVFVENDRWPIPTDIPPWVIKLVLDKEEL